MVGARPEGAASAWSLGRSGRATGSIGDPRQGLLARMVVGAFHLSGPDTMGDRHDPGCCRGVRTVPSEPAVTDRKGHRRRTGALPIEGHGLKRRRGGISRHTVNGARPCCKEGWRMRQSAKGQGVRYSRRPLGPLRSPTAPPRHRRSRFWRNGTSHGRGGSAEECKVVKGLKKENMATGRPPGQHVQHGAGPLHAGQSIHQGHPTGPDREADGDGVECEGGPECGQGRCLIPAPP